MSVLFMVPSYVEILIRVQLLMSVLRMYYCPEHLPNGII